MIELVGVFEGKIIDVAPSELTVMLAGHPDQLDGFEELLRPYGITELQRTGRVALAQAGATSGTPLAVRHGKAG